MKEEFKDVLSFEEAYKERQKLSEIRYEAEQEKKKAEAKIKELEDKLARALIDYRLGRVKDKKKILSLKSRIQQLNAIIKDYPLILKGLKKEEMTINLKVNRFRAYSRTLEAYESLKKKIRKYINDPDVYLPPHWEELEELAKYLNKLDDFLIFKDEMEKSSKKA